MTVYDAFFRHRFQNSLRFHLSTLETFSKRCTVFISVLGGSRVDARKRIKSVRFHAETHWCSSC